MRLDRKGDDGVPYRRHLEAKVRRGDKAAAAELEIPDCPEAAIYLVEWAYALYGRDGAGMGGLNLLSNREIEAWARLRGIDLQPYEADALLLLNAALCLPDAEPVGEVEEEEEAMAHQPAVPQWPRRPDGVEPQFVIEED